MDFLDFLRGNNKGGKRGNTATPPANPPRQDASFFNFLKQELTSFDSMRGTNNVNLFSKVNFRSGEFKTLTIRMYNCIISIEKNRKEFGNNEDYFNMALGLAKEYLMEVYLGCYNYYNSWFNQIIKEYPDKTNPRYYSDLNGLKTFFMDIKPKNEHISAMKSGDKIKGSFDALDVMINRALEEHNRYNATLFKLRTRENEFSRI